MVVATLWIIAPSLLPHISMMNLAIALNAFLRSFPLTPALFIAALIALTASFTAPLICAHAALTDFLNVSLFFHRRTSAATHPAIAAAAIPTGPVNAANAVPSSGSAESIAPIAEASPPKISKSGPIAAVIAASATTNFFAAGDILLNLVASFVIQSASLLRYGVRTSPTLIASPSKADFNIVIAPPRLSNCVCAILDAAPPEFEIAADNSLHRSVDVPSSAFTAFRSRLLNIAASAFVLSSPERLSSAFASSGIIFRISRILPWAS